MKILPLDDAIGQVSKELHTKQESLDLCNGVVMDELFTALCRTKISKVTDILTIYNSYMIIIMQQDGV